MPGILGVRQDHGDKIGQLLFFLGIRRFFEASRLTDLGRLAHVEDERGIDAEIHGHQGEEKNAEAAALDLSRNPDPALILHVA